LNIAVGFLVGLVLYLMFKKMIEKSKNWVH
jgi:hypothetical protein